MAINFNTNFIFDFLSGTQCNSILAYFQDYHGMNELESNLATRGPQIAVMAASGAFIVRDLVELFRDNPPARRTRMRESMIPGVYNLEVMPSATPSFTGFSLSGSF